MKRPKLAILLIEDDENDAFFFERASQKGGRGVLVRAVSNARGAVQYLQGQGKYSDRKEFPRPNLIVCDLKMAGMDGFEFLEWVRAQPECSTIPVLILSSSALESDVRKAYKLGASSFMAKPSSVEGLAVLLSSVYDYWSRCEYPAVPVHC